MFGRVNKKASCWRQGEQAMVVAKKGKKNDSKEEKLRRIEFSAPAQNPFERRESSKDQREWCSDAAWLVGLGVVGVEGS